MHSLGASRKRFLTIFFIKRNSAEKQSLFIPAGCDPGSLKGLRKRGIIWMQFRGNNPWQRLGAR
jgi:hypothetical protein